MTSLDGGERIVVDDNSYSVANGASYIIQPGALHDLSSTHGSTPCWVHFDLLFDPRRSEPRTIGGPYDSELGVRSVHLQPDAQRLWGIDLPVLVPPPLDALFRSEVPALIAEHRNGLPGRMLAEARLAALVARFVALAWGSQPGTRPNDDLDRLARAEAVARQRLDSDFTLHSFAAVAGLGRS